MTAAPDVPLLRGVPARGGIYRADRTSPQTLADAGWRVGEIDSGDPRDLVIRVGEVLGFPSYYGRNLDALADCLSDRTGPTALVWHAWGDAAVRDPRTWSRLLEVLQEATERPGPPLALLLARPWAEVVPG